MTKNQVESTARNGVVIVPTSVTEWTIDTANKVRAAAERIRRLLHNEVDVIIEVGTELCAAKDLVRHGHFEAWLLAEFGMSARTARNYMRAAEAFGGKSATVADLQPTTLYLLAAPSTPSMVRDEVIKKIDAGERLGDHAIKVMVAEAKRVDAVTAELVATAMTTPEPERRITVEGKVPEANQSGPAMLKSRPPTINPSIQRVLPPPLRLGCLL
jgi:hypothetical protein